LDRLRKNNLQINGPKSTFCTTEADFLGFILTRKGVKPQLNKVEAFLKLQTPHNIKQICSFIGMINYYKDDIQRWSCCTTYCVRDLLLDPSQGRSGQNN
jgi:hypothetical protein